MFSSSGHADYSPSGGYDLVNDYENPLAKMSTECSAQSVFYRIVRPLFPLVEHVYVAALIRGHCPNGPFQRLAIYGASKGIGDLQFLQSEIQADHLVNQEVIGEAENGLANAALNEASQVSLRWQDALRNPAYRYARVVASPLLGRPCAMAARDVIAAIQSSLHRVDSSPADTLAEWVK